jgi:putative ABC transport system permease protein
VRLLPLEYAVRNLGRSPTRLALSLCGSMLVVLLVLAAGGFVSGMSGALSAAGGEHNVIVLGAGSEESVERSEIPASVPGVLAASLAGIASQAGVAFVSPEVHVMLPVGLGGAVGLGEEAGGQVPRVAGQATLRGVTPTASLVHERVRLVEGRWPAAGSDQVLAGRALGAVLGVADEAVAVGRRVWIDGRAREIVGRFAAPGTMMESELWMPLEALMEATRRQTISCVVLTLVPYDEATGEGAEIGDVTAFALTRPDLELAVISERAYFAGLSAFYGPIRVVVWVTAGLIALGGVFGGLNTMYAAFASRTRELGTLQALGYRRRAIVLSMVQECTLATAAGALVACGVAVVALDGLAVRFSMGAFGLRMDAGVLALGMAVGLGLGVVGALPPALRSLRPAIPVALKAV